MNKNLLYDIGLSLTSIFGCLLLVFLDGIIVKLLMEYFGLTESQTILRMMVYIVFIMFGLRLMEKNKNK